MAKKAARIENAAVTIETITLLKIDIRHAEIKLEGDSPLICHAWADKSKKQMLDKQMKKAKQAKDAKNPEQDYEDSFYRYPGGGYGFPVIAFKAAAVDACSHVDGITKVEARGAFHIAGDLAKIVGTPRLREDMVRIAMGSADVRYRAEFPEWSVVLRIRYNASVLSLEQINHLFNVGGFAVGVGEWRPEKNGSMGMFHTVPGDA